MHARRTLWTLCRNPLFTNNTKCRETKKTYLLVSDPGRDKTWSLPYLVLWNIASPYLEVQATKPWDKKLKINCHGLARCSPLYSAWNRTIFTIDFITGCLGHYEDGLLHTQLELEEYFNGLHYWLARGKQEHNAIWNIPFPTDIPSSMPSHLGWKKIYPTGSPHKPSGRVWQKAT